MQCPKCSNEVVEGKKFCRKCGASMRAPRSEGVQASVQCPKCQKTIAAGKKFCNRCGASLEPSDAPFTKEEPSFPSSPEKEIVEEMPPSPLGGWKKSEETKETPVAEKKEEKATVPPPLFAVEPGSKLPESSLPPVHSLPEQNSGGKKPWWLLIVLVVVLIAGGVAGYLKFRKRATSASVSRETAKADQQQPPVAHPTVAPATVQAPKPSPSQGTPSSAPAPQTQTGIRSSHQPQPAPISAGPIAKPTVPSTVNTPQMTSTLAPMPHTAPVPEQEHVKLVPPQPPPGPVHPQVPAKPASTPTVSVAASSGFIVWRGVVEKGGVIEFNGNVASPGSIQTGLPGVPVQIDLDTKNFALVEFPSASNNYRRMRIRSKNKVDSIIIKWQRAQ